MNGFSINLIAAWAGIVLGFLSGMVLGTFFHREGWLGGYASSRRRLYRLGHISLFGLGAVNLLFWLTLTNSPTASPLAACASWLFIVGAITMPVCCVAMAHIPKARLLFVVPVLSLIAAGALTLTLVLESGDSSAINHQLSILNSP